MSDLDLNQLFPFPLDDFQQEAIAALNASKSTIVCAPTGSGKTLIGEYAIYRALANQKRVFYTTPLKALSNQKLRDFQEQFGPNNVGLLTGDLSFNRDAPIIVMTTEIFRNMLYGTRIGEVGTSIQGVQTVVLDECHYMNDRQRGTVWEESIIYCPPEIQLVGLSATVANSDQLTDWISQVHGPTARIYSEYRPVPLQFLFCNRKGVFPLLNSDNKLNNRLKPRRGSQNRRRSRRDGLAISYVVSQLRKREMLPAIYFIFSRRGCDRSVKDIGSLVNDHEAAQLKTTIDEFLRQNPDAGREGQVEPLYRGIAAHHAGILPAWKGLVEQLFQRGLIKVVFATETLAAGINMPARTTVISSLSKRTDRGHRLLTASEFLQMAGRAGRRGMDEQGYVVTLETPFEGAIEAANLATSKADPLVSQFTPNYGMVLNLLQTHSLDEAKELIERSFGQYLAGLGLRPQQQALQDLDAEITAAQSKFEDVDPEYLNSYEKLQERLKEERRILKTLQQQAGEVQNKSLTLALQFAVAGSIVQLKGANVAVSEPLNAVLVTKRPGPGKAPYLICLGANNRWYVITTKDVVSLRGEIPRLEDAETQAVAAKIPPLPVPETAPEVQEWQDRVAEITAELERHPLNQFGNPGTLIKRAKRLARLQRQRQEREERIRVNLARHWEDFLDLIDILIEFDCLDGVSMKPTRLGESIAAVRGDNELWLGLAITSGQFDRLTPEQFAAACAALVMEVRADTWTRYSITPEVEEALGGLRGLRRKVIQIQWRYQVAFPVWLEWDALGLVEYWAYGVEWTELCENTSLDEGDIVRILRRTLDFLSQIPHIPHVSPELRRLAWDASELINRFPVRDEV